MNQEDLLTISCELCDKLISHNYESPDVFALFGYCSKLIEFAQQITNVENLDLFEIKRIFDKELDMALSNKFANRENYYAAITLLGAKAVILKNKLENKS